MEQLLVALARVFGRAAYPGWCNICRGPTLFTVHHDNLREDVFCCRCRSFNRKRQVMHVLERVLRSYSSSRRGAVGSTSLSPPRGVRVWNTEASGSLHEELARIFGEGYVASEYLGPGLTSGETVGGVRHEDMRATSFAGASLDLVISCDVLEHVPGPDRAFGEVSRILKPGGRFLFTVPCAEGSPETDFRVRPRADGSIEQLKGPVYHGGPARLCSHAGVLVCQVFGDDILDMCGRAGLECEKVRLHDAFRGILGPDAVVFVARKPGQGAARESPSTEAPTPRE